MSKTKIKIAKSSKVNKVNKQINLKYVSHCKSFALYTLYAYIHIKHFDRLTFSMLCKGFMVEFRWRFMG